MGAWVCKWEPGVLGSCIWARASSAHKTVLALCLKVIDLDFCAVVGYPPFSALWLHSSHVRDKALGSEAATVCVSWWKLPKDGANFGSCFSLTYLCFTHFLAFHITVIKIHFSGCSSPVPVTENPLVTSHICKKITSAVPKYVGKKKESLGLNQFSLFTVRWLQSLLFLAGHPPFFFSRITEVHKDFPQSEIHKGTVRDWGNGPHSQLPWGWFIFCFMCDGHQSAPEKNKRVHTSLALLGCYNGSLCEMKQSICLSAGTCTLFCFSWAQAGA